MSKSTTTCDYLFGTNYVTLVPRILGFIIFTPFASLNLAFVSVFDYQISIIFESYLIFVRKLATRRLHDFL